ncbi:MAG: hypothetical protein Q9167_007313 [Letrouitia subvulpina]
MANIKVKTPTTTPFMQSSRLENINQAIPVSPKLSSCPDRPLNLDYLKAVEKLTTTSSHGAQQSNPKPESPITQKPKLTKPSSSNMPAVTASYEDIEKMISQLNRTKLSTAATLISQIDRAPDGTTINLDTSSTRFHSLRTEAKRVDKRKRDLGVLSDFSKRQKHGFRPEELLWHGAMELENCKPSNLTNEIHPLFHRDCFDDTPDPVYDQLIPGLRLATMFLTQPDCMQFWITLAKGERKQDLEMSRRCGQRRHRIIRNVKMTKENTDEVIQYIRDLGDAKVIHFTWARGLLFHGHEAFGTAARVCDFSRENTRNPHTKLQRCHIKLNSDFYVIAKKMSRMKYPDEAQKLRFNFNIAIIMLHESAHTIELSQWLNREPSPYEPFLLHQNDAELGFAWENYMFGGRVAPINDRVDGNFGIGTYDWPLPPGELNPERTIVHSVSMRYIENLQQNETWQRESDAQDWRHFHIPRDGATSIYLNAVTTVPWSEEERVAKEELDEMQMQEKDQPAKKKREMGDGGAIKIKVDGIESETAGSALESDMETTAQQTSRNRKEPEKARRKKHRRARPKPEKVLEKGKEKETESSLVENREQLHKVTKRLEHA